MSLAPYGAGEQMNQSNQNKTMNINLFYVQTSFFYKARFDNESAAGVGQPLLPDTWRERVAPNQFVGQNAT